MPGLRDQCVDEQLQPDCERERLVRVLTAEGQVLRGDPLPLRVRLIGRASTRQLVDAVDLPSLRLPRGAAP